MQSTHQRAHDQFSVLTCTVRTMGNKSSKVRTKNIARTVEVDSSKTITETVIPDLPANVTPDPPADDNVMLAKQWTPSKDPLPQTLSGIGHDNGIKATPMTSKHVRDQITVDGFIRTSQQLLPSDIIPVALYAIIFDYYHLRESFHKHWGTDRGLEYPSDTIVRQTKNNWASCIFGDEITPQICSEYSITIKWIECCSDFYMGFVTVPMEEYSKRVKHTSGLGQQRNSPISVGIAVEADCSSFVIYDERNQFGRRTPMVSATPFENDSEFTMTFNFDRDTLVIDHNKRNAHTMCLNGCKRFMPAFSFYQDGDAIEVIHTEYKT